MSSLKILIFLNFGAHLVNAYGSGAPSSRCNSMQPGHSGEAQTSNVPFELAPSSQIIEEGEIVTLDLKAVGNDQFKGFMVQAFDADTSLSLGSFLVNSAK